MFLSFTVSMSRVHSPITGWWNVSKGLFFGAAGGRCRGLSGLLGHLKNVYLVNASKTLSNSSRLGSSCRASGVIRADIGLGIGWGLLIVRYCLPGYL